MVCAAELDPGGRIGGARARRHRRLAQPAPRRPEPAQARRYHPRVDVSQSNFASAVLERSYEVPVVVDFWAPWCAPCRQLGPVIERAVGARAGQVELAKVDADANPGLSATYRVQSIPAVKGFRDGKVVAEFVGAQPPDAVERFLDSLAPSEADALVALGDEDSLRRALELEPRRADSLLALARILHTQGEADEALECLARISGSFAAYGLAARIALERSDDSSESLQQALAALDAGEHEHGLDLLLTELPSADGAREDIRRVVVGVLDELGVEHPLARESRRRLAAALYT